MTDTKKRGRPAEAARPAEAGKLGAKGLLAVLGALALAALLRFLGVPLTGATETRGAATVSPAAAAAAAAGVEELEQAFRDGRSDLFVQAAGEVVKLLPDDREGSRHQKFLVEVGDDLMLLFAHNIDLAPRVPLDEGDWIEFRGEYEYTEKGGTVHWTHRDPKGWREGGWIRLDGRTYE